MSTSTVTGASDSAKQNENQNLLVGAKSKTEPNLTDTADTANAFSDESDSKTIELTPAVPQNQTKESDANSGVQNDNQTQTKQDKRTVPGPKSKFRVTNRNEESDGVTVS